MLDADRLKVAVALLWEVEQAEPDRNLYTTAFMNRLDEFLREYRESRPAYGDPALVASSLEER